jgi:hypothetical protein
MLLCCMIGFAFSTTPSAEEVMKKVEQAYQGLTSYSDSVTVDTGVSEQRKRIMRGTTLFRRPGQVSIRLTGPYDADQTIDHVLWSHDDKIWLWRNIKPNEKPKTPYYGQPRSLFSFSQSRYASYDSLFKYGDIRETTRAGMPIRFLVIEGQWGLRGAWEPIRGVFSVSSSTVEGKPCWRLRRITEPQYSKNVEEIDVDAGSFLVRRYYSDAWETMEAIFRPVANPGVDASALVFSVPRQTFPPVSTPPQPHTNYWFPPAPAPAPVPGEAGRILDRCRRTYETCRTYSDSGELTRISYPSPMMHAQNPYIVGQAFRTRFVHGTGLLVDATSSPPDPAVLGFKSSAQHYSREVTWWVGGWNRAWSTSATSLHLEVSGQETPQPLTLSVDAALHLGHDGTSLGFRLDLGAGATLRAEEIIDGRPCYVVGVQDEPKDRELSPFPASGISGTTIWIDKSSYLVRQMRIFGPRHRAVVRIDPVIDKPIPLSELIFEPPLVKLPEAGN